MATISEALAIAVQDHQGGRLQAAEQAYRQILAVAPNQPQATFFLGVIAFQLGRYEVAVEYLERAIRFQANVAPFHDTLGETYRALRKLPEAIACFRRAVELKPDYDQAHFNLGNALKDQGNLEAAADQYRQTLGLKPGHAEAHINLGNTLKLQGKSHEAVCCYRRALELKAGSAEANYNLGIALKEQGKPEEAVGCYRRALELKPEFAEANYNLGIALKDQGDTDGAIACYRRAVELKPDYAEAHINLGIALYDQGKSDEAIACYCRALELRPDDAGAHGNLGIALHDLGKLDEATACYRRVLELKPDDAEAQGNLGVALNDLGKLDEAIACYRRALERKPFDAKAHNNLGIVLEEIGDLRGAEDCFRAALRHDPRSAFAHHKLAVLLGGRLPQQDLAAQRRLLEDVTSTDAERLLLHFGLAYVLDALGEYAEAAGHLDRGNALQLSEWRKRGRQYDPQEHELLVTRIIGGCTPEFFERVRGFGLESEVPVFVVGLPRSGTTLIEQILAAHSQVFGAGELKLAHDTLATLGGENTDFTDSLRQLDRTTVQRLALRHLERLRQLDPTALRIVDKMPENYLYLGLLASLFPRAKLIHCRRDLRDVAVSCWMTHFQQVRWSNDPQHIASRFHQYQRVMEHWSRVLPAPLLEVDYEETVADLEGVARRLVAWCGLKWESGCLGFHQAKRPVKTASAAQVRQPVFKTSLRRWQHYEQSLAALLNELAISREDH